MSYWRTRISTIRRVGRDEGPTLSLTLPHPVHTSFQQFGVQRMASEWNDNVSVCYKQNPTYRTDEREVYNRSKPSRPILAYIKITRQVKVLTQTYARQLHFTVQLAMNSHYKIFIALVLIKSFTIKFYNCITQNRNKTYQRTLFTPPYPSKQTCRPAQ